MNNKSEKFRKYLDEYIKKTDWELIANPEYCIYIKLTNGKVFAYIDYQKNLIHIPEISNNSILSSLFDKKFTKTNLKEIWKCSNQIEFHITDENRFSDYAKLLEIACRKINPT